MKNRTKIIGIMIFFIGLSGLSIQTRGSIVKNIEPIADAYINSYFSDDNYGASDYLSLGELLLGREVSYIKFDIPDNDREIISAIISTYWYNFMCETWLEVSVGKTSNSWSEYTITWNNAPYYYEELIATSMITDGDYFSFDVLDYITSGGLFSIIIWEVNSPYTGEYLQSDSKENDLMPNPANLRIEYKEKFEDVLPSLIGGVVGGVSAIVGFVGIVFYWRYKRKGREIIQIQEPTVLYCSNCGSVLEGEFCSNCGKRKGI